MDEISEFLLFIVTDGAHFGFYALENFASPFKRGVGAYFFTNTLSYLKQPSNVTCRRLVPESWFWTLLLVISSHKSIILASTKMVRILVNFFLPSSRSFRDLVGSCTKHA